MNDIELAFSHPQGRSLATSAQPCDRLLLRDYIAEVEIGAFQKERGQKQRLMFNVVVEIFPVENPIKDDVDRVLSYDRLIEAISNELTCEHINLLETLAERVAGRILTEPQVLRVFIRIEKLDIGPYKLGVEIVRDKLEFGVNRSAQEQNHAKKGVKAGALVVYLDNEAMRSPDLLDKVDIWVRQGLPMIFTVGSPDLPRIQSADSKMQRRIELLAIEQNACKLAECDARFSVLSSRTEIEWAIERGQIVIWSPFKMISDTKDSPKDDDIINLTLWLADVISAQKVILCTKKPIQLDEYESSIPIEQG